MARPSIFFVVFFLCAPASGAGFKAAPVRSLGPRVSPAAAVFTFDKAPVLLSPLNLSAPSLKLSLESLSAAALPAAISRPIAASSVLNTKRTASVRVKPSAAALGHAVEGIGRSRANGDHAGVRNNLNALFGERIHTGSPLRVESRGDAVETGHPGFGRDGRRRPSRRDLPGRYLAVLEGGESRFAIELFIDADGGYEIQIGGPDGPGERYSGRWRFIGGRFVGSHRAAGGQEVPVEFDFGETSREALNSERGGVVGLTSPIFGDGVRLDVNLTRLAGPYYPPTAFENPEDVQEAVNKVKALFKGLPRSGEGSWSNEAGEKAEMSSVVLEISEEAEDRVTIKVGFNWPEGDRVERTIYLIAGALPELRVRTGFDRGPAETAGLIKEARLELGAQHLAIHTSDAVYTLRFTGGLLEWTVSRPDGTVAIRLRKPAPAPAPRQPDYWPDDPHWPGSHHRWGRHIPPMF